MFYISLLLLIVILYTLILMGGRGGRFFFIAGVSVTGVYILYRSLHLGHLSVTDKHDILVLTAFLTGLYYLYLKRRYNNISDYLGLLPVLFVFLAVFQERIDTISPHMNSPWFYLHALLFVVALSLLSTGSAIGLLYIKTVSERKVSVEDSLELLQYKFILAGWLVFSLSLIAGGVWFFLAQGVYWLWTAKELWLTITWFYYTFYLHGRYLNYFKGERIAEIGSAGLLVILFTYLGVTPVLGSPWTQF